MISLEPWSREADDKNLSRLLQEFQRGVLPQEELIRAYQRARKPFPLEAVALLDHASLFRIPEELLPTVELGENYWSQDLDVDTYDMTYLPDSSRYFVGLTGSNFDEVSLADAVSRIEMIDKPSEGYGEYQASLEEGMLAFKVVKTEPDFEEGVVFLEAESFWVDIKDQRLREAFLRWVMESRD